MKIYFAGSIRGGRSDVDIYKKIIDYLNTDNKILTEHIGDYSLSVKGQNQLDNDYIRNRDIDWLKESDLVVADTSNPSLGVGYELAYAEKIGKPVIILHNKKKSQLSAMIEGSKYFNDINYYSDVDEVLEILKRKIG
ncbi:nucleoside 2-deoxyribosyltransferase [Companilactobacillus baiquanensis]|uniref:Putative 2'-deoxynucleoside 5'-phosphate N-hydrolase 1 n=1 Tax=Companilactobacillus baiquanensis TaxID=2486005 RepID=A0ABW1UUY1_9LACO|nr:nucleoside 2-deoxyribosyltransferase [Companilactobacillus baiquanensis]